MGPVEMHQNPGTVNSLPDKGIVGELIGVIPGNLGGQEILHAAALHDLGQRRAVAEGVRQPESIGCVAEILPGELLPPDELADHVLAGRDIAVALDPHAAVGLVAPLCHALLDVLEQVGLHPLDDVAVVGRTLDKGVFRVLIHQVHLIGVGSGAFPFHPDYIYSLIPPCRQAFPLP